MTEVNYRLCNISTRYGDISDLPLPITSRVNPPVTVSGLPVDHTQEYPAMSDLCRLLIVSIVLVLPALSLNEVVELKRSE